jgi:hypothetical protein
MGAARATIDRDLGYMDLVLAESELSGTADEVLERKRLDWKAVSDLMRPSLNRIQFPEVRAEAARRLARRLLTRARPEDRKDDVSPKVEGVISFMPIPIAAPEERAELQARVGLELLMLGEQAAAERVAEKAMALYKPPNRPAGVAPSLVALLVALGKGKLANELVAPPTAQGIFPVESRIGHALGEALQGDWDKARKFVGQENGEAGDRFAAYLALAELSLVKKQDQTASLVDEAFKLIRAPRVTPWMQFQLMRVGARVGKAKEMADFAKATYTHKDYLPLLNRALLEITRGDLLYHKSLPALAEMQAEADKKEQAYPPALALLARHNARYAGTSAGDVERWEPESLRPLGLIGVALGLKDRDGDRKSAEP